MAYEETRKKYYLNNKKKILKQQKIYNNENKEIVYQRKMLWRFSNLEKQMFERARKRAKAKCLAFDITITDIIIPEFCPVLGQKMEATPGGASEYSPSLDRIVPELGYIKPNIRVISYRANKLKNNATISELELILADAKNLQQSQS